MSNIIVTLGGVRFQDFEVPEKIVFGGRQRVAVQSLIGGGRVVNLLGGSDDEIIFNGIFSGDDAAARAQLLDGMRQTGVVAPLVWDSFYYAVVLAEFVADYTKPWWIPFAIKCVPTVGQPGGALSAIVSAADLIAGDVQAASAFSVQAGASLVALTSTSVSALASAQSAISSTVATGDAALTSGATAFNAAPDAAAAAGAFTAVAQTSAQLAALTAMSGYVNRAANNAGELLP